MAVVEGVVRVRSQRDDRVLSASSHSIEYEYADEDDEDDSDASRDGAIKPSFWPDELLLAASFVGVAGLVTVSEPEGMMVTVSTWAVGAAPPLMEEIPPALVD
jgi:hypothetical protein